MHPSLFVYVSRRHVSPILVLLQVVKNSTHGLLSAAMEMKIQIEYQRGVQHKDKSVIIPFVATQDQDR